MAKAKLHDDWFRIGTLGNGYDVTSGPKGKLTIHVLPDGEQSKRRQSYRMDEVYARLIQQAYERGLKNLPLWG